MAFSSAGQVGDPARVQLSTRTGRVYGKVVDSKSNKGVEAASVQIFVGTSDSLSGKTDSLVGGMLSRPNGDFNFDNLPLIDTFKFILSAVGYRPLEMNVFIDPQAGINEKDLGNLKIQQDAA